MMGALIAASNCLACRYVLAGVVAVTVAHALISSKEFVPAVVKFVLADVLLKLVSGLSTKEYGLGAATTYLLAVFKAVDVALLAQNGVFLLLGAGEDEGGGSCQNEDGELHACEWVDVDGVVVVDGVCFVVR